MTLIIACGLKREAKIVHRPGRDVFAVVGGGQAAQLEADLDDMAAMFPGLIVSAGIAGALDPALRPGDVVIDGDADMIERLRELLPNARVGAVIGGDTPVVTAEAKRALAARTGGLVADMESHIARRVARARGFPFAAIRAVADTADQSLPPAALVGMAPDGGMALGAVLLSLARQPGQLPGLMAVGRHAGRAFKALEEALDRLMRGEFDRYGPEDFAPRPDQATF